MAFHLEDGVAAVVEVKALAAFGDLAELRHHEAGESFKAFFTRQSDVILGFQVAQVEATVEHHGAGGESDGGSLSDIKFVFKLADDLLQHVFNGDKATDGAKFIDHNGEVALAFLKFDQKIVDSFAFRNEEHFTHDVADFEVAGALGKNVAGGKAHLHDAGKVFGIKQANDVFTTFFRVVNRNAGVLLVDDFGHGFIERHVSGKRKDFVPRNHDLAHADHGEFSGNEKGVRCHKKNHQDDPQEDQGDHGL